MFSITISLGGYRGSDRIWMDPNGFESEGRFFVFGHTVITTGSGFTMYKIASIDANQFLTDGKIYQRSR